MNKKIILISIDKWCLKYLNDSFTDNLLTKLRLLQIKFLQNSNLLQKIKK